MKFVYFITNKLTFDLKKYGGIKTQILFQWTIKINSKNITALFPAIK